MVELEAKGARQVTPLSLVLVGLIACAVAEHFGFRDLVTIAVATNAAGLALLTQHGAQVLSKNNGTTQIVTDKDA